MAGSYAKIDYRVRPAKSIERKMMVESFRLMSEFLPLTQYRYVGMGSIYFADFSLFHRALGFETMVSIEDATDRVKQARFHLNVPYGHIEMKFGHTNAVLQRLVWREPSIVWLDYDGSLTKSCLIDTGYLAQRLQSGSVFVISVSAGSLVHERDDGDDEKARKGLVAILEDAVGKEAVPYGLQANQLSGWGVAKVFKAIIDSAIQDALITRNASLPDDEKVVYKQVFNFNYRDGMPMLTVGGVFVRRSDMPTFEKCGFERLDYVRTADEAYMIVAPLLTYKEMRQIDAERRRPTFALPLPPKEVEQYVNTYRYFPHFVEAELS